MVEKLKVSDFKGVILKPAMTSHFICEFSPPATSLNPNGFFSVRENSNWIGANYSNRINSNLITLSCCDASLPGSSLMTNEIADDHTGVTERHAYRRQYDDRMDFSFFVDNEYRIINFFESWISLVSGENRLKSLDDRNYFYRVSYPVDYQTDLLSITKFERDYKQSIKYKFVSAYPISISSMPVTYETSQVLKCTVSFTYIRYYIEHVALPSSTSNEGMPASPPPAPPVPSSPPPAPPVP